MTWVLSTDFTSRVTTSKCFKSSGFQCFQWKMLEVAFNNGDPDDAWGRWKREGVSSCCTYWQVLWHLEPSPGGSRPSLHWEILGDLLPGQGSFYGNSFLNPAIYERGGSLT